MRLLDKSLNTVKEASMVPANFRGRALIGESGSWGRPVVQIFPTKSSLVPVMIMFSLERAFS